MSRAFSEDHRTLTRRRLAALSIAGASHPDAASAVRSLLAVQAQDFAGALWSLGLRTAGATAASVEAEHERGAFVRSWPQRGTLHFVAAEDLGWMLSLTGERMTRAAAGRHRQLDLDEPQFDRARDAARDRLGGGEHASRRELLAEFEAAGVSIAGQRGVHLLGRLSYDGVLVQSGRDRYTLLDRWGAEPRRLDPPDALREYAARYFTGHGPATVEDFAWWSSLTLGQAREGLRAARDQLDELEVAGSTYYLRPGLTVAAASVDLLPGFDEYLLGYRDRTAPLAGEPLEAVVPGLNGMFLSTVVVGGEVRATWSRRRTRSGWAVSLSELAPLSETTRERVRRGVARYARFLGQPVEL
ncbi:MAG: winged helix DNA-binding domain-containing protein [Microbacteriaceae bacterium]